MATVHSTLLLALVGAALVEVAPGPDDSCPSSAQVAAALESHAPRLVAAQAGDDPAMQVTLTVTSPLANGNASLYLVDRNGLVRLYRTLPASARQGARDCLALAETVSLIVNRYFEEIGLPALPKKQDKAPPPPSPPPPTPPPPHPPLEIPRFGLSLDLARRFPGAAQDMGGNELKLAASARLGGARGLGDGLWVELAAGMASPVSGDWEHGQASGSATLVRSLGELAILWGRSVGPGRLYTGPSTTIDLLWLDASSSGRTQRETRLGIAAGLRVGYQFLLQNRFFARADLGGFQALRRYEVTTQSVSHFPILAGPPRFLTLTLGVGIFF